MLFAGFDNPSMDFQRPQNQSLALNLKKMGVRIKEFCTGKSKYMQVKPTMEDKSREIIEKKIFKFKSEFLIKYSSDTLAFQE